MADAPVRTASRTSEALLDAALAVFTERTYGGAAVAMVADRAGVSVGTLYRHFPSKEALGNAVFQRWKRVLLEGLTDGANSDEPVREAFGRMWRALLGFATESPDAFAFLEMQQHESYLDADSQALISQVDAAAQQLVLRGQRAGEIRDGDPAMLVALAYGAVVGLVKARRGGLRLTKATLADAEGAVWALLRRP